MNEPVDRDEEDLVRLYLTDIGQYTLLTKDDEARLAQLIENGITAREQIADAAAFKKLPPAKKSEVKRADRDGEEAWQTLVQSNLRLVVVIARKYQASGLPLLDLIQEGNLGLIHAVEKFDWREGFSFSTYATWWIREAIKLGIAQSDREMTWRLYQADSRLERKNKRQSTISELAVELEMSEEEITDAFRSTAKPFAVEVAALLPNEIKMLLASLNELEIQVLALRFGMDRGEPRTLEEVGEHFNLLREQIREIEQRAMSKLRHPDSDTGTRDILAV